MSLSNSGVCVADDLVGSGFSAEVIVLVAHASLWIHCCHLCVDMVLIFQIVVAVVFLLPLSSTLCS
jgi:hypothetical protein